MITIIEAQAGEYHLIQHIVYTTWPVAYGEILSKEQLDYMLAKFYTIEALKQNVADGHRFLLAKDGDETLGFIGYENNYKGLAITKIHKIYIMPETQGRGIGKLLIDKVEQIANENHSLKLSLNVNRFNTAQAFYRKLGFEITLSEDIAIGNGYLMEDYVMEKAV